MHSQHRKLQNDREDSLLSTAIELERHCYSRLRSSNDFREGVEAFHGKRQSKFNGS
jgi:2-oxoglutaroyl-CoA hydrolase